MWRLEEKSSSFCALFGYNRFMVVLMNCRKRNIQIQKSINEFHKV